MKIWWVILPLTLYYLTNNVAVLAGRKVLEMYGMEIGLTEQAVYLQTGIKMFGMLLGGVAVYPFYKREKNLKLTIENKRGFAVKEMGLVMGAGILSGIGLNLVFSWLGVLQISEGYNKAAESQYGVPLWLAVIFYGILSPAVEELVFRGITFQGLKRQTGTIMAIAGSAVLFGAFHGNAVQLIYASIMGLILAWIYERYETLIAPVLFHGAANVAVYVWTLAMIQP